MYNEDEGINTMTAKPLMIQQVTCSFCVNTRRNPQTRMHDQCPGAIRIPGTQRVIVCKCCTPRDGLCTTCGNRARGEVDPITWYCLDPIACSGRVQARMLANPVYQVLQAARLDAAAEQRRQRVQTARIQAGIDPTDPAERDSFGTGRKPSTVVRPRSGSCLCCGGTTKGGRFLPGHDAKYASRLAAGLDAGHADAWQSVIELGWTDKPMFRSRKPALTLVDTA